MVGDPAPEFSVMGSDGKLHALSDSRGNNPLVIAFFPKAFTGGWTLQCKSLRDSDKEIQNFNLTYYMASTDNLEKNTAFAEKNSATFPILADPDKKMSKAYGVLMPVGLAKRWTFYIDKSGIIQKIDKKVNARTAGADLVEHLKALQF